jgi:UDP-N-acetylmuramyl pentapeptide synthase
MLAWSPYLRRIWNFSSVDEIALAKRELIEGRRPRSTAVLNADDARCRFGAFAPEESLLRH